MFLRDWTNTLVWSYVDGYEQTTRPGERVKPYASFDLNLACRASAAATVSLIVHKLGDKRPSWDSSTALFDHTQGDPRGRVASLRVNYRF